jgi:hypothetical protein
MPTVLRQNGFEFIVRTRDHEPPHVHAFYGREQVLIGLGLNENDSPYVYEVRGMSRQNVRRALEIAIEHNDAFLAVWRQIYG